MDGQKGVLEKEVNPSYIDSPIPSLLPYKMPIQQQTSEWREFICGWGAAVVNVTITFPINKVMFRQQLCGMSAMKAIGQLQKEGIRNLYRGLLSPFLQKSTTMSLMFGLYYYFQRELNHHFPTVWLPVKQITAGMLAGTVEAVLTPFERVQVLMQDKRNYNKYSNTVHAVKELYKYGLREYYRGLTPILLRNGPSNVAFFMTRDYIIASYPSVKNETSKIMLDFISGALLGALISTISYPINVVKVRMQAQIGGPFHGFIQTSCVLFSEREWKLTNVYRGVHINYTRAFISWGVINATYEFLIRYLFHEHSDI
ncbi:hypothetical protein ACJMK2_002268 [Sinanodonta woodiana]|uniref:Solute carrier family 25 member 51 n=1 Tax=Sinanodonta woodiana TaxID=1069815 RepID=A0ABD3XX13_SINWO